MDAFSCLHCSTYHHWTFFFLSVFSSFCRFHLNVFGPVPPKVPLPAHPTAVDVSFVFSSLDRYALFSSSSSFSSSFSFSTGRPVHSPLSVRLMSHLLRSIPSSFAGSAYEPQFTSSLHSHFGRTIRVLLHSRFGGHHSICRPHSIISTSWPILFWPITFIDRCCMTSALSIRSISSSALSTHLWQTIWLCPSTCLHTMFAYRSSSFAFALLFRPRLSSFRSSVAIHSASFRPSICIAFARRHLHSSPLFPPLFNFHSFWVQFLFYKLRFIFHFISKSDLCRLRSVARFNFSSGSPLTICSLSVHISIKHFRFCFSSATHTHTRQQFQV